MSTGDQFLNVTRNRILGVADLDDRFLSYLQGLVRDGLQQTFLKDTVFQTPLVLAADGDDKFKITGGAVATDGQGHFLSIAASGFSDGIQFENTSPVPYDVGLRFAEQPTGIQVNPRTGLPDYVALEELIGDSADPDSVVDNGNSTITLVVDSVAEAGVTHAGRTVRVCMKIPAKNATTAVIAIEDVVVAFVGGLNQITTTGDLGQPTISTTPADYSVIMLGPTVRRNENLETASGTVFVGRVTGSGSPSTPSVFSTAGQSIFDFSFADLADFTRCEVITDKLKIDVKSFAGDEATNQIQVQSPSAVVVFGVDGTGKAQVDRLNLVPVASTEIALFVDTNTSAVAATGDELRGAFVRTRSKHTGGSFSKNIGLFVDAGNDGPGVLSSALTGVEVLVANFAAGAVPTLTGVLIDAPFGAATLSQGLKIADVTNGVSNRAIVTGQGSVVFGDEVIPLADTAHDLGLDTLKWDETHTRFLSVGNVTGVTFSDGNALKVNVDGVTVSNFRGAQVFIDTDVVAGSGGIGIECFAEAFYTGSGGTILGQSIAGQHGGTATGVEVIGQEIFAHNVNATGTVIAARLRPTRGVVGGTVIGLQIFDVVGGSTNFAIDTDAGIVRFGDDVIPRDPGKDIGTIVNRWQNVVCEQMRASEMPAGSVYEDITERVITLAFADVVLDTQEFAVFGVTEAAGVFTVADAGRYWVSYSISIGEVSPGATTPSRVQTRCVINGSTDIPQSHAQSSFETADSRDGNSTGFPVLLAADDTIRVQIRQVGTGATTMVQFANYPDTNESGEGSFASFNILAVSITD